MGDTTTRPSLLLRLQDPADELAWREFDVRYRDLVLRYCSIQGLQHWDAEDVRQMVMLSIAKVLRAGFEYRPEMGRFRGYLGRVVRNAIVAYRSRPRQAPRMLDTDDLVNLASNGPQEDDESWEAEWRGHHLRLAMHSIRNTFDERHLRVFDRLISGQPVRTVSAEFEMTEQAVHKVKQRIRNRLRELIARQIRDEDGFETTA